jgi:hypothetical protein
MPQQYSWNMGEVEAEQLTSSNVDAVAAWCGGRKVEEFDALDSQKVFVALNVMTLDGPRRAQQNDYIVKFPAGNFKVVPQHLFTSKYTAR